MSAQTDLYDEILSDIITLTARPDLAEESAIAFRSAVATIHGRFNFPRDLTTVLVKLPNASYQTAIDIQVSLPRLRALSQIRLTDPQDSPVNSPIIDIVEVGDIYDPVYNTIKNNIAFIGGASLNIRNLIPASGYIIDYYLAPFTRREQFNSWIAQLSPEAIIFMAAATVFQTNGNEEKATSYLRMVENMYLPTLIANYGMSVIR
jgi:hypothetical protein